MLHSVGKVAALISAVKNPLPAIFDRLGLLQSSYVLNLRSGTSIELRPKCGDLFGFYEIMLRHDYLSSGQTIAPGSTVIDVGANIGCFTMVAAKLVGPTGRVFALEPEESTFKQLEKNIELNHFKNVTALKIAMGANDGETFLNADPNHLFSSMYSSVNGHTFEGQRQRVEITTFDSLMTKFGIAHCDYLKLDCEGAEHDIFGSMSLATAKRIGQITMEVHKIPDHSNETLEKSITALNYRRIGDSTLPFYVRAPEAA